MAFLPEVEDWIADVTSSSVTLKIHFLDGANPNNTDWKWFFYRKDPGQTGQYDKSLSWGTTKVDGTTYYTITISGLSANTKYVGRLTDVDHKNDSETLFGWTTKPPPDPYVSSVVSNAAGQLTITVANRNDKGVVFKCAPPVNSSYDIRKTPTAWQDSFTFTNCYYGQTYFGGAEIADYTLKNKTAKVQGTCSATGVQKGTTLTVSYTVTDNGNYTEWSLDNTNWYSVNTAIDYTFSSYGSKPGKTAYFRAVVSEKVVTDAYTITTAGVELTKPATQTIKIYHYNYSTGKAIYDGYTTQTVNKGGNFYPGANTGVSVSKYTYSGWGYSLNAYESSGITNITQDKTIFYFYNYSALSATSSVSKGEITVTTSNGIGPFSYYISPYNENEVHKYENKSESSYTFPQYPYGRQYHIKIKDAYDTYELNVQNSAGDPTIVKTGQTFNENTGKYNVNISIVYKGYESVSFNKTATVNENAATVNSCAYNDTITATFSYVWSSKLTLTETASLTLSLTQPYSYTYTLSAYYIYQETLFNSFDNGTLYSLSNEVSAPTPSAYPEYIGYAITNPPSGQSSSGSSNKVKIRTDGKSVIIWKYRKDSYPYRLEQWYYNEDGDPVQYKGPDDKNPPYDRPFNLEDVAPISGNLTGKGQLLYYLIGTNRVNGDGSDIYTIDLTNYKNTLVEIRAYFYMNLEWTKSPQLVSDTNILTAAWKGGRAGYRFKYFTKYTHHYSPGPSGYNTFNSYTSEFNLPGGYVWQAQVADRTGNTLGPITISGLKKPTYDANTLGLDPSDNKLSLTAKIEPFLNTGYKAARLEYKRSTDSNWTTGTYTTATTGTTNLRFDIENDVRNNTNDSIIYQSRVVWYKSDYDEENGYKYEHSSTIATWPIGYKIQLKISDKIQSLNVSYVTAANEVKLNDDLSGNTTHILWLQHGSKLVINSFSPVPGWYGQEFSIKQGEYKEIFESATYTFDLINKTEYYRVYLYCGSNISQFTIRYCDFIKYNNTSSLDQGMTTKTITREDSPQTIEVPLERSNFTIESWTGEDANASLYDESTMSPTPTIVGGKYTYDAARFAFGDFVFNIDFYKTKFTKSAYVDYCTFQLIDENGIRDSEQITLTSDADGIYFYEFSPTQPYHTQIKIIDYKLIAGRKNFYMNISGDSERYYLKDYSNNLIPIERGESYIFNGDDYTNPSITIEPDKYSVTCSYSYIDEEVFLGSLHKVTFTQQESGTEITEFIDFKTTNSITFTNVIENNKYSIFADTEFTILTELWDAQSNRWIEITSEGNKTLPRDIPDFTIQPNISNRAYGDISNYQDYDKVVSYHWNTTASLANATSITVINNKTENVNTQKIPSGNQPFELDSTYYARIVLGATDGSDATWTSKWVKIDTPDAYTITFVLNNISSIAAKSDLTNNENKIFENNGVLTVSPNSAYEISGINSYSSLTTPYNRKMFYTSPVYYTITKDGNKIQNGVFVNRDNSVSKITGNMDTPALTITLTATPADWVWPNGYTKDTTTTGTPILTKGGPVNLFEYEAWNELMFYLNKWGQYLNKLYTNYENTLMTSENTTLTAAIYNHAYAQLNTLFTNLSDAIVTNAVSNKTSVTAKGLEDFGNTINYNNIKE